jgi:hypothetical protein
MDLDEKNYDSLQSIITRMANNSSNCKTWAITITAGSLAVSLAKDSPALERGYIQLITLIPFWFLDCYYLALEKHFRKSFSLLVSRINAKTGNELCAIAGPRGFKDWLLLFAKTFSSFSTWGFYVLVSLLIILVLSIL